MPAVKSRWHTYATSTILEAFRASRDHRGFAGFSMGSVNTWHTFQYCLDYFGWFIPISGSVPSDGSVIAWQIADQGFTSSDFFIYSMSGTDGFAYSGIKIQIQNMKNDSSSRFIAADSQDGGSIAFREQEGFERNVQAAGEYTHNGMRLFFNGPHYSNGGTTQQTVWYNRDNPIDQVRGDGAFDDWGRMIFPVDEGYMSGDTLGTINLAWYSAADSNKTVTILLTG